MSALLRRILLKFLSITWKECGPFSVIPTSLSLHISKMICAMAPDISGGGFPLYPLLRSKLSLPFPVVWGVRANSQKCNRGQNDRIIHFPFCSSRKFISRFSRRSTVKDFPGRSSKADIKIKRRIELSRSKVRHSRGERTWQIIGKKDWIEGRNPRPPNRISLPFNNWSGVRVRVLLLSLVTEIIEHALRHRRWKQFPLFTVGIAQSLTTFVSRQSLWNRFNPR